MSAQEHPQSGFDVAIVGFGPTGAVLANLLGARGWRIGVFDREPDLWTCRARCISTAR